MNDDIRLGLTFDDVLLVPRRSSLHTRREANTATRLSRGIELAVPILSANMDTVTEARMAIAMARMGGLGIVHRFLPVEAQVAEVSRVKRTQGWTIDQPYSLSPDQTIADAREFMRELGVTGFPVVDQQHRLLGIVSARDIRFARDPAQLVRERMTPRERLVTAPAGTTPPEAMALFEQHKIEKLPLVDSEGRLCGLMTAKDLAHSLEFPQATTDPRGRLRVGAAIGVVGDYLERAAALAEAGVDALVIDIAHGHSDHAIAAATRVRERAPDVQVIAGNVATAEGTRDLIAAGVDAVKVGVGPGSICITRWVAGVGVPQVTAIMDSARAAAGTGIPIIADGGIRRSGDVAKALAAGASSVMVGNLLAGTDESPGLTVMRGGRRMKISRGMASLEAALHRRLREKPEHGWADWEEEAEEIVPEGVEAAVPYRGEAADVVRNLVGGLRSGMSYCNARTLEEFRTNAVFIRMTEAGRAESGPHDVELLG